MINCPISENLLDKTVLYIIPNFSHAVFLRECFYDLM